jgi:hypothetical protein
LIEEDEASLLIYTHASPHGNYERVESEVLSFLKTSPNEC